MDYNKKNRLLSQKENRLLSQKENRLLSQKENRLLSQKKGISEVVTILLIVLLVLAAIAIVWQVIMPLIKKSSEGVTSGCVTLTGGLQITQAICDSSNVNLTVARSAITSDITIKKLKFVFSDGTNSNMTEDSNVPAALISKTFQISRTNIGTFKPTIVAIAPVIATDTGENTCDPVDRETLTC